jgi:SNF2 family DNA or RNA helicase
MTCACAQARHRWLLSGTPVQNTPEDLFSYFVFLRYEPYDNHVAFRKLMHEAAVLKQGQAALDVLRRILVPVMLRRTKLSEIDRQPILRLPGRCSCRPDPLVQSSKISSARGFDAGG